MRLGKLAGWRGILAGIALLVLGLWAVTYTCNTETAACKGAEPWPGATGFLYGAGWVVAILGIALFVVAAVAWIVRVTRERSQGPRSGQTDDR
jgi:Na+/melibiose symporter-like transporter